MHLIRESEIRKLSLRLYNQPQIPTLEGLNGIGKTSIINVAIYRTFRKYLENRDTSALFIPCISSLQLTENTNSDIFIEKVFTEIAQTLIKYKDNLKSLKLPVPNNINEINRLVNYPHNKSKQMSIGVATIQLGGGQTIETNTSNSFEKNGFQTIIKNWLKQLFPKNNSGGIVCVIDNLELLENSVTARKVVEELRDSLFSTQGIRWIMCGSLGIVSSIVSSPRLEGLMHDPIEINSILKMHLSELFEKRILAYKLNEHYYLPITEQSFMLLYDVLKWNIRNTLKYANDYCTWIVDNELRPISDDDKESLFMKWIVEKSNKYYNNIKNQLDPTELKLFNDVIEINGIFALNDYELFGFSSYHKMKKSVQKLESVGLLISVIDENDRRRKSIQITPKGWFVSNAMNKKKE